MWDGIRNNLLDIGITNETQSRLNSAKAYSNMRIKVLKKETMALVVPKKLSAMNLTDEESVSIMNEMSCFILSSDNDFLIERFANVSSKDLKFNIKFAKNSEEIRTRIALGEGYAIISKSAAERDLNDELGIICLNENMASLSDVCMVAFWKSDHTNPFIEAFTDKF
jgi:DNA-binding transcriptional LysR family regulator